MGVPKLFKWISERYPLILSPCDAFTSPDIGVQYLYHRKKTYDDISSDNLYLDSNGIIHNATHGNAGIQKQITDEEMIAGIFQYIDRLFQIVKPRKLLFIAIDGVAPRAKLNQQRSRRFRSMRDREDAIRDAKEKGEDVPTEVFDSNCITPGTEFMFRLSVWLKYFVRMKLSTDKLWEKVSVIVSGCDVPGEGEHKIMSYIRAQRELPDYSPATSHCIYGQDADLIMLSLATHEPNFVILREELRLNSNKKTNQSRVGEEKINFQFLHLSILREYLMKEFESIKFRIPFAYDFERVIDDFVLICFFVGNDFIPKMPGLDISQGSLSDIFSLYIKLLPTFGTSRPGTIDGDNKEQQQSIPDGYLVRNGIVNWHSFERLCQGLASQERSFFMERGKDSDTFSSSYSSNSSIQKPKSNLRSISSTSYNPYAPFRDAQDEAHYRIPQWRQEYYKNKFSYDPPPLFISDPLIMNKWDPHHMRDALYSIQGIKGYSYNDQFDRFENSNGRDYGQSEFHECSDDITDDNQNTNGNREYLFESPGMLFGEETNHDEEQNEEYHGVIKEKQEEEQIKQQQNTKIQSQKQTKQSQYFTSISEAPFREMALKDPIYSEHRSVIRSYMEAVQWVFLYYYRGCVSWSWYYPYIYAPLLCDLCELTAIAAQTILDSSLNQQSSLNQSFALIDSQQSTSVTPIYSKYTRQEYFYQGHTQSPIAVTFSFKEEKPVRPFEQLLSVLPPGSDTLLPAPFRPLMHENDSPLIQYYPLQFEVDMEFAHMPWEGVCVLPFMNVKEVEKQAQKIYPLLSQEETRRNSHNTNILFRAPAHKDFKLIRKLLEKEREAELKLILSIAENRTEFDSSEIFRLQKQFIRPNNVFPGTVLLPPIVHPAFLSLSNCKIVMQRAQPNSHQPFPLGFRYIGDELKKQNKQYFDDQDRIRYERNYEQDEDEEDQRQGNDAFYDLQQLLSLQSPRITQIFPIKKKISESSLETIDQISSIKRLIQQFAPLDFPNNKSQENSQQNQLWRETGSLIRPILLPGFYLRSRFPSLLYTLHPCTLGFFINCAQPPAIVPYKNQNKQNDGNKEEQFNKWNYYEQLNVKDNQDKQGKEKNSNQIIQRDSSSSLLSPTKLQQRKEQEEEGIDPLTGFVKLTAKVRDVKMTVFGYASRQASLILTLSNSLRGGKKKIQPPTIIINNQSVLIPPVSKPKQTAGPIQPTQLQSPVLALLQKAANSSPSNQYQSSKTNPIMKQYPSSTNLGHSTTLMKSSVDDSLIPSLIQTSPHLTKQRNANPSTSVDVILPIQHNSVQSSSSSQAQSIILHSPSSSQQQIASVEPTLSYALRFLIGCACYYNWPHLRPGRIFRVEAQGGICWELNEGALMEEEDEEEGEIVDLLNKKKGNEKILERERIREDLKKSETAFAMKLIQQLIDTPDDNKDDSNVKDNTNTLSPNKTIRPIQQTAGEMIAQLSPKQLERILKRSVPGVTSNSVDFKSSCEFVRKQLLSRRGIEIGSKERKGSDANDKTGLNQPMNNRRLLDDEEVSGDGISILCSIHPLLALSLKHKTRVQIMKEININEDANNEQGKDKQGEQDNNNNNNKEETNEEQINQKHSKKWKRRQREIRREQELKKLNGQDLNKVGIYSIDDKEKINDDENKAKLTTQIQQHIQIPYLSVTAEYDYAGAVTLPLQLLTGMPIAPDKRFIIANQIRTSGEEEMKEKEKKKKVTKEKENKQKKENRENSTEEDDINVKEQLIEQHEDQINEVQDIENEEQENEIENEEQEDNEEGIIALTHIYDVGKKVILGGGDIEVISVESIERKEVENEKEQIIDGVNKEEKEKENEIKQTKTPNPRTSNLHKYEEIHLTHKPSSIPHPLALIGLGGIINIQFCGITPQLVEIAALKEESEQLNEFEDQQGDEQDPIIKKNKQSQLPSLVYDVLPPSVTLFPLLQQLYQPQYQLNWYTLDEVAQLINTPQSSVRNLVQPFVITVKPDSVSYDIGLPFCIINNNSWMRHSPFYVRFNIGALFKQYQWGGMDNENEKRDIAINILLEYRTRFPDIFKFAMRSTLPPTYKKFNPKDIFPQSSNIDQFEKVKDWMKRRLNEVNIEREQDISKNPKSGIIIITTTNKI
ncbi:MAG: putative 5'-3' exoribonuclease 1 [Streblomastix strix]|uniref:Putative 5'-3' exoribonuclease 1 n=1 Tax=Streblomastix strix TaxID=222440 RepID=A0A5J4X892_9EUKA|nr:MAG: putative 5'-3' exoribonuclease 1 [Streblomastix strix]